MFQVSAGGVPAPLSWESGQTGGDAGRRGPVSILRLNSLLESSRHVFGTEA